METTNELHYSNRQLEAIKYHLLGTNRKTAAPLMKIALTTLAGYYRQVYLLTGSHCENDLTVFVLTHDFTVNAARTIVTYKGKEI